MLSCGSCHALLIDPDGFVYAGGRNNHGQLGQGHTEDQDTFCLVKEVSGAVQVSAALKGYYSAVLDHQGNVWMFGANDASQTGINGVGTQQITLPSSRVGVQVVLTPTKVQNLPKITAVSCGNKHSLVLDDAGCIWGAGDNSFGQLSSEGVTSMPKFAKINTPEEMGRVVKICCGYKHSIAQNETDELWSTGSNLRGALGLGHNQDVPHFQKITSPESDFQVQSFHCGRSITFVLDRDGGVWNTGDGRYGSLGLGDRESKNKLTKLLNIAPMVQIMCGEYSVMMKDRNGIMYACGFNDYGQLGLGLAFPYRLKSPKVIPNLPSDKIVQGYPSHYFSLLADDEGRVWRSGYDLCGPQRRVITKTFVQVEGIKVNVMSEKRFRNTKRAQLDTEQ